MAAHGKDGDGNVGDSGKFEAEEETEETEETEEYWRDAHEAACVAGAETYVDAVTGLTVFTRLAHEHRGKCCGCGCRHCPFKAKRARAGKTAAKTASTTTVAATTTTTTTAAAAAVAVDAHRRRGISAKPKNCVYTKTGDAGTSSLFTGERVSKDDAVFEALGTIDELVSFCGAAHAACLLGGGGGNGLHAHLAQVIKVLMTIASHVATPASSAKASRRQLARTRFGAAVARPHIAALEAWIDDATDALPDLRSFVLPLSGTAAPACAALHVCRSVCRRCERRVLSVGADVDPAARKYLNRLSDFLFVAARYAGDHARRQEGGAGGEEVCYRADEVARDAKAGLRLLRLADSVQMTAEKTVPAVAAEKVGGLPRSLSSPPPSSWFALVAALVAVLVGAFLLTSLPVASAFDADVMAAAADKFDVDALLDGTDIDVDSLLESLADLGLASDQHGGRLGIDETSEALRVFQQVQEELAREEIDLSGADDRFVWGAVSSIRTHENSMRFLGRMRDEAAALAAPYLMSNYGYGMVFFAGFRDLCAELFAPAATAAAPPGPPGPPPRPPPRRVLVLGSNLGTEALFFMHLFGGRQHGLYVTGVVILCDLVAFARENVREHGFNESYPHDDDRLDFVCGDALDVDAAMLADADVVWIDNQVWDLPLAVGVAEMLRRAEMKTGAMVVDFASAAQRGVAAAYAGEVGGERGGAVFEERRRSESSKDASRRSSELFRLATSWAGSRPGAPVRVFVRR